MTTVNGTENMKQGYQRTYFAADGQKTIKEKTDDTCSYISMIKSKKLTMLTQLDHSKPDRAQDGQVGSDIRGLPAAQPLLSCCVSAPAD